MPSSNSNLYQVSVCCLFFGYKDNELKLLVRNADSAGKLLFPEKKLQTGHSLYETACGMAGHLLERNDYYIKQIGAGDSEMSAENEEPSLIVTYYVLTQCDNLNTENSKADDYYWISLNEANLNGEQKMLVETTLKRVRRKIGTQPVAFYLLPTLFTLSPRNRHTYHRDAGHGHQGECHEGIYRTALRGIQDPRAQDCGQSRAGGCPQERGRLRPGHSPGHHRSLGAGTRRKA